MCLPRLGHIPHKVTFDDKWIAFYSPDVLPDLSISVYHILYGQLAFSAL